MEFYKILKEIMDEKDLTIPEVARKCDLTDSTVRSIFDRKQKKIALNVAFKLSNGLGVSLERLNGESGFDSRGGTGRSGLSISQSAYEVAQAYDAAEPRARESVRYTLNLPPESEKGRQESVPVEISEIDAEVEAYRQELLAEKEAAAKPEASPTTKGA